MVFGERFGSSWGFLDGFWAPLGVSWAFRLSETLLFNENVRGAKPRRLCGPCGIPGVPRGTPLGVLCVAFCRAVVRIGVLFEMSVSSRRNAHFEASCDPWAPMGALCLTVGSKFTTHLRGFREVAKNSRNFFLACVYSSFLWFVLPLRRARTRPGRQEGQTDT